MLTTHCTSAALAPVPARIAGRATLRIDPSMKLSDEAATDITSVQRGSCRLVLARFTLQGSGADSPGRSNASRRVGQQIPAIETAAPGRGRSTRQRLGWRWPGPAGRQ